MMNSVLKMMECLLKMINFGSEDLTRDLSEFRDLEFKVCIFDWKNTSFSIEKSWFFRWKSMISLRHKSTQIDTKSWKEDMTDALSDTNSELGQFLC